MGDEADYLIDKAINNDFNFIGENKMNLKFGVQLTEHQLRMSEGIDWLIVNGGRTEGKTLVCCMAFIKRAYLDMGLRVNVFDHYGMHAGNKNNVFSTIDMLFNSIEDNDLYRLDVDFNSNWIRVRYATPAELTKAREDKRKRDKNNG